MIGDEFDETYAAGFEAGMIAAQEAAAAPGRDDPQNDDVADASSVPWFSGTIFDKATGQVLEHFDRTADSALVVIQNAIAEGRGVVEGRVPFDQLVNPDTGRTRARAAWKAKVKGSTITGLPEGTRAMVQGRWAEIVDGKLSIAADYPETVRVFLQHPQLGETELDVACEPGAAPEGAFKLDQDGNILRATSYPPIGDQLDMLIKGLAQLPAAQAVPELKALIDASAAVKARFPKKG